MLTHDGARDGLGIRYRKDLFNVQTAFVEAGWKIPKRFADLMVGDNQVEHRPGDLQWPV